MKFLLLLLSSFQKGFLLCDSLPLRHTLRVSSPQWALVSHGNIRTARLIHVFSCCHTHQNFTAVTKPAAAILPSQDEGKGLAVKAPQKHRMECLGPFMTHCREKCVDKCVISTSPFEKLPYKQENEKLCVCTCVFKTKRKWELLTRLLTGLWNYMWYYMYTFNHIS